MIQNVVYPRHNYSICCFVSRHIARYFCLYCSVFYRSKVALHHTVCCCSVEGLSERAFSQEKECYDFHQKKSLKFFSWSALSQQHAIWTFCQKDFDRLFWSKSAFSFKIFFAFLGSFIKVFNIYKLRLYKIKFDAWPIRSTVCSINLMWSSTDTGTVSSGAFLISSNPFHKLERSPRTSKIFCCNFSVVASWFRTCALYPMIGFTK